MYRPPFNPWASNEFRILVLLICCWGFVGTAGAVTLEVKIRTQSGELQNSLITLKLSTEDGGLVDQQTGGPDTRFQFNDLARSQFRLRVEASGYRPSEQEVDLTGPTGLVYLDVLLAPLEKARLRESDLPALSDENAPKKARREYEKGARALQQQKKEEAMAHFEKAVAEYPCYARAQTNLARVLVLQNKIPQAEEALKKSIVCDGGYLEAYTKLAILMEGTKQYTESEKILAEGLRHAPDFWVLYYQLGATHASEGELEKAVADYLKVRSLNPLAPTELHVRLADVYHRMKAYDKAYAEMQAYVQDDPNGRYAARTRAVMQEMESSGLVHPVPTVSPQP